MHFARCPRRGVRESVRNGPSRSVRRGRVACGPQWLGLVDGTRRRAARCGAAPTRSHLERHSRTIWPVPATFGVVSVRFASVLPCDFAGFLVVRPSLRCLRQHGNKGDEGGGPTWPNGRGAKTPTAPPSSISLSSAGCGCPGENKPQPAIARLLGGSWCFLLPWLQLHRDKLSGTQCQLKSSTFSHVASNGRTQATRLGHDSLDVDRCGGAHIFVPSCFKYRGPMLPKRCHCVAMFTVRALPIA